MKKFREFNNAREWAQKQNIRSRSEWITITKEPDFPIDIPKCPYSYYKKNGWISWGNWLGTEFVALYKRKYKTFEDAREWTRKQNICSPKEWAELTNSQNFPVDIPKNPFTHYRNKGWISWGDWHSNSISYRSFDVSRQFVRNLGIKTSIEWFEYTKSDNFPKDLYKTPHLVYHEWISWADWLNTEKLDFNETHTYAISLGLKTQTEWIEYTKRSDFPENITKNPQTSFKYYGWKSWSHFLKNIDKKDFRTTRTFRTYEKAKEYATSLGLTKLPEWVNYDKSKFPIDMPKDPYGQYKNNGWISWPDFLGQKNPL